MKNRIILFILVSLVCIAACKTLEPVNKQIWVNQNGWQIGAGAAEAQFDKAFGMGSLDKKEVGISYFPNDDVVCPQFRVDFITYYQFWDRENRTAFISSLNRYKGDYSQKNLTKKGSRGKRNYGIVRSMVIWETHRFSHLNYSYPNLELGYYFKSKNPYFAITQREAPNENQVSKESNPHSRNIVMYMTRAQADVIAEAFDPAFLVNLRMGISEQEPVAPETEDYVELEL